MPLPVPTIIASGFDDASGSAYRLDHDQLIIVDTTAGTINAVTAHPATTHVQKPLPLGTGYTSPCDIVLSADGFHAYVVERQGTLLLVDMSSVPWAAPTVIASGLGTVDQIALDEAHGFAYVAEFKGAGRLLRIKLSDGTQSVAAKDLHFARGVLLTGDSRFVYVSEDAGQIRRFDLTNNTNEVIASGLNGPRHLTWADAGESAILFPQGTPTGTGTVLKLDLTASPPAHTAIAGPTPDVPYSVAIPSPEMLLIVSAQEIGQVNYSVYSSNGPILLGIGFVPNDPTHLPGGYADTMDMPPSYPFRVKDAPFGGTLPLMIIHQDDAGPGKGAAFYKVTIQGPGQKDPVEMYQPFSDYLWSGDGFKLQTTVPADGYYPLRSSDQIWLNFWLGLMLDTTGQPNGLNTISVKLFSKDKKEMGTAPATVMIDNTVPTARIEQVLHDGLPVSPCAIVNSGSHTLTFKVTAQAEKHLGGWSLTAYWGDNKSTSVAADDYSNHVSASRTWPGLNSAVVPPPGPTPWDAYLPPDQTSKQCAHTFFLSAWDRVINGWGSVHGQASYHQSITLML